MGQSTKTMLAQIVADQLGGDMAAVTVTAGDTAAIALGFGGFNSRQAVMAGSSAHVAARVVRAKLLAIAGHLLEVAPDDLDVVGDRVRVRGAAPLSVAVRDVARAAAGAAGFTLPGGLSPGLEATEQVVIDDMAYANGSAVAEVEVDAETGAVALRNLVIAHDAGRMINPMIVDGQVIGGAAHGIGNALFEWMGFDDNCQPTTTTLGEYLLISATEMPRSLEVLHRESPSPLNPLGVKGVGECGVMPVAAAIVSAIEDALAEFDVRIAQTPIRPHEILALIAAAGPRAP
jgi:carbon-monoxide dehydrogenase large subunit